MLLTLCSSPPLVAVFLKGFSEAIGLAVVARRRLSGLERRGDRARRCHHELAHPELFATVEERLVAATRKPAAR